MSDQTSVAGARTPITLNYTTCVVARGRGRVALLWRGEHGAAFDTCGLPRIDELLRERGFDVEEVPFSEEFVPIVRQQLMSVDAVLVWVDPISTSNGRNRSALDPLLREIAARGTWVSAHPDAILKLGTKDILVKTRAMEWGTDCYLYQTQLELAEELPGRLRRGPRVLKQYRGNGGNGVYKVEIIEGQAADGSSMAVRVLHAQRGSQTEDMRLDEFVERCSQYFEAGGRLIDQPFQDRLPDGQIRCYVVAGKVTGFGHQFVTALLSAGDGRALPPNPRRYFGPSQPEFQSIKAKLEGGWIEEMREILGIDTDELPILWDADFLYGPKDASGADSYVLCEINASSVDIFPDETLVALADAIEARLAGTT